MSKSSADIAALVAREMSVLTNDTVRETARNGLVDPWPVRLNWDYGEWAGNPDQQFDGWVVFDHAASDTLIVYCDQGFGPTSPWGLIAATPVEGVRWIGQDSGWFGSFIEAFLQSWAALPLTDSGLSERL